MFKKLLRKFRQKNKIEKAIIRRVLDKKSYTIYNSEMNKQFDTKLKIIARPSLSEKITLLPRVSLLVFRPYLGYTLAIINRHGNRIL